MDTQMKSTHTPTLESQCNVRLALESYWYAAHSGSQRSQCKSIQILLVRRMSNNVYHQNTTKTHETN